MITYTFERLVNAVVESNTRIQIVSATGHNRYGIDPETIDQLQETWIVEDTPMEQQLVVDGILHPGQIVDLSDAIPSITVQDRRDIVLRRLSDGNNPLATICLELRQCRIDHRQAMQQQRHAATDGPDDSGRVNELNHRKQTLQDSIESAIADQQQLIKNAYSDVDARIGVINPIGTESAANRMCSALTSDADSQITGILRPVTPVTTTTTIGPHEVAVTRMTPLVNQIPTWYERVIAGTLEIFDEADVVVTVNSIDYTQINNESADDIKKPSVSISTVVEQYCRDDTEILSRTGDSDDEVNSIRADVAAELPDTQLSISLPYTDSAQATVSQLYDDTTVESISYDERITLTVRVAVTQTDAIRRAVTTAGGSIQDDEQ
ncbi:hypothetical protein [Haloquadratum walsbyi]|uniref:Uncharacterized protein n=1 Tax=Haloquadratum walsbyi J07HQW2 TaxID=1238425 RepID=U1N244_9EURY|nr:hypothetical protein [Haloquadratum walsbyi]ERG96924.1 MAG: hypothetical protein J07HQW2_03408 [Haloquadratum walsbyi J07HQW2]